MQSYNSRCEVTGLQPQICCNRLSSSDECRDTYVVVALQAFDTNRDGRIDAHDAMRSRQDLAAREIGRALM